MVWLKKLLTWRLTTINHSSCRLKDGNGLVIRMYVLIVTFKGEKVDTISNFALPRTINDHSEQTCTLGTVASYILLRDIL